MSLIVDRQLDPLISSELLDFGIPTAAYIHIPFCRRRCYYCDFPVSVVGDRATGEHSKTIAQYVKTLCAEIDATPCLGQPLETVFFGGGTPSLLSVQQLDQILHHLAQRFGIASTAEISLEIDPGTFDRPQLQGYRVAGINRVSLGVQSFESELLTACGRTHTPEDIDAAVNLVQQADFSSFSLDLISGLPQQTLTQWQRSLERAIALKSPHLSIYDLIVEPVTAFGRWYQPGVSPLPSEETAAQMYRIAQQTLTAAGYEHYEISNYAQIGHQCRHNCVYWENRPYYGFGMGAASYVQGKRFTRPRKRSEYFLWVENLIAADGSIDCLPTPATEVFLDTLMLGLRLAEGLGLNALVQRFGKLKLEQILTCLEPYQQQGWVEMLDATFQTPPSQDQRLRLTDPEGFLFSNTVLTALFRHFESY